MKITKLITKDYKRFSLNNIERITYTPECNTQLILGTNGSGKSSLLELLSPLPPQTPASFGKDGYKEIHIENGGHTYILIYDIIKKAHSFQMDGVELNDTHQKSVQLALIEEHFNLNYKIQSILLGKEPFTELSPTSRKDWLFHLSQMKFDYSLNFYKELQGMDKEATIAIKLGLQKLQSYKSTHNPEFLKDLYKEQTVLQRIIQELQSKRDMKLDVSLEKLTEDIKKDKSVFKKTFGKLEKLNRVMEYKNKDKLVKDKEKLMVKVESCNQILNSTFKQMQEISSIESQIGTAKDIKKSVTEYETSIQYQLVRLKEIPLAMGLYLYWDGLYQKARYIDSEKEVEDLISNLKSLSDYLSILYSLTTDLIETYEYNVTEEKYKSLLQEQQKLESKIQYIKHSIDEREARIEQYKKDDVLETIKCNTCQNEIKWSRYKQIIQALGEEIDRDSKTLEKLNTDYEKVSSILGRIEEIQGKIKEVKALEVPVVVEDYIDEAIHFNLVDKLYYSGGEFIASIRLHINRQMIQLKEDMDAVPYIVSRLQDELPTYAYLKEDMEKKKLEYQRLESLVDETRSNVKLYKSMIEHIDRRLAVYKQYEDLIREYENTVGRLNQSTRDYHTYHMNLYLTQTIKLVKDRLLVIENEIIENKSIDTLIKQEEDSLRLWETKSNVYKKMLYHLSPQTGLIGKSLYGFLEDLIENMNKVIKHVWSYPMELVLPESETFNINFKFPVHVNHGEVIEDISKLSAGMKSIVNLAFIIVFRSMTKIEDYPLYLDEFGNTFDPVHREKAFDMIDKLRESIGCQFFIVNHFDSMYGRLSHVDINVLDDTNIKLPTSIAVNNCLEIE